MNKQAAPPVGAFGSKCKSLIVSHDAGGAWELASWVKHMLDPGQCDFLLDGPAAGIYPQVLGPINCVSPGVDVSRYPQVLTSTSGVADWERQVIQRCRNNNVAVNTLLDHWVNYRQRFVLKGKLVYPDTLWVLDDYAERLVTTMTDVPPVERVESFYLRDQVNLIRQQTTLEQRSNLVTAILYLSEPAGNSGYSEFEALQAFIKYLADLPIIKPEGYRIRLRLHPAEQVGKYDAVLAASLAALENSRLVVEVSSGTSLAEDCAWSDWVVGCQTRALVVALSAGKPAYSSLPSRAPPLVLPHKEIIRLFE